MSNETGRQHADRSGSQSDVLSRRPDRLRLLRPQSHARLGGRAGADIVALCDLDRTKAEDFARTFDVPAVYIDAAAMLPEATPAFVDVATTVASHRPLVELALGSGARTICQKPFAESYATASPWSRPPTAPADR